MPATNTEAGRAGSGSGSSPEDAHQSLESTTTGDGKAPEKTISCTSCRKRKLKCDRIKPSCGTCSRLRHDCEYPERRRNLGSKRRNMKELEARLAEVETRLVAETKAAAAAPAATQTPPTAQANISVEADWNTLDDPTLLDPVFDVPTTEFGLPDTELPPGNDYNYSQELLALGLDEPLPPQDMIDELHQIYFDKFHPTMPVIHKYRYYASLDRAPQARPPICLRYAMWAMACSLSDKFMCLEDLMYQRARHYIQAAEMKGHGEAFVTIYHAQTWSLIAFFEAKKTYFSRSWMSTGRAVRMVQMLGLYRLDAVGSEVKQILAPPRDWIDLEERRRTFWAAFYGDRWASSGTGWPMLVNEFEIRTNLPASEDAFELGVMEKTPSLAEALTPEGASNISPFGGVILSATLYGHNFEHLHRTGPNEHPEDPSNGEFWKRHRKMDNVLSNTFMFLPDHLRLPAGLRDMNVVFIHMNIHASSICLHQAAIVTAGKHNVTGSIVRQSQARCLMAAEEISNIMRLICHVDASSMNSWVGFCLYVAAGVFLKDQKSDKPNPQNIVNIEFLLAAMSAIGLKHSITRHFSAQLELDVEAAGLKTSKTSGSQIHIPNTPINGLLADRNGVPMTVDNLNHYASTAVPTSSIGGDGAQFTITNGGSISSCVANMGIMPMRSDSSSAAESPNDPQWNASCPLMTGLNPKPGDNQKNPSVDKAASPNFGTPNSVDSNPIQLPHRQADTAGQTNSVDMFPWAEPNPFVTPSHWETAADKFDLAEGVESFLQNNGWDHDPILNPRRN
ncbi:hypothetical protein IFR05_011102 [Cadophora sp. M221]|nr:hypothetical protein IFR05_011102 [Cadophora sp. M221]